MKKLLLIPIITGMLIQACELSSSDDGDDTSATSSSSEVPQSSDSQSSSDTDSSSSAGNSSSSNTGNGATQRVVGSETYEIVSLTDSTIEYKQDYWECLEGSPSKETDYYEVDFNIGDSKLEISSIDLCDITYYEGASSTAIGTWEYKGEFMDNPDAGDDCEPAEEVALTDPKYTKDYKLTQILSDTEWREDFDVTFSCYAEFFANSFKGEDYSAIDGVPEATIKVLDCNSFEVDFTQGFKQVYSFKFHDNDFDMTSKIMLDDNACEMTKKNIATTVDTESSVCTAEAMAFESCNADFVNQWLLKILRNNSLNKTSTHDAIQEINKKIDRVLRSI